MSKNECLMGVAIRINNTTYWHEFPSRHYELVRSLNYHEVNGLEAGEEGFITDNMRFVTRQEAAEIAKNTGQLKYPNNEHHLLYSEDVSF